MNPEAVNPTRGKIMAAIAAFVLVVGALFALNVNWAKPASAATCPTKITLVSSAAYAIAVKQNSVSTATVELGQGESTPYSLPVKNYCYIYAPTNVNAYWSTNSSVTITSTKKLVGGAWRSVAGFSSGTLYITTRGA